MQEPTKDDRFFNKKIHVIKDYLSSEDMEQMKKNLKNLFSDSEIDIDEFADDVFSHIHPVIIYTQGQFQAITDSIFTVNGASFSNPALCKLLRRSEFVFPHIITIGKEIEDYALVHEDALERKIIRYIGRQTNAIGQSLLVEELINEHGVKQVLPVFPGEPGWKNQEGIRIFELFGSLPEKLDLSVTKKGLPSIGDTSYGLLIAN